MSWVAFPPWLSAVELGASEDDGLRAAPDKICDRSLEFTRVAVRETCLGKHSVPGAAHVVLLFALATRTFIP